MLKKLLITFLAITLLVSLTACNSQPEKDQNLPREGTLTQPYSHEDGWSFEYPLTWELKDNYIQEKATGKTVLFDVKEMTKEALEQYIDLEIERKLEGEEADNTIAESLSITEQGKLIIYKYSINSKGDGSESVLKTIIFFDGERKYEFGTTLPPVSEEEFQSIVDSFKPIS